MNSFPIWLITAISLSLAPAQAAEEKSPGPLQAIAVLHPTSGNKVAGTITFTEEADGVPEGGESRGNRGSPDRQPAAHQPGLWPIRGLRAQGMRFEEVQEDSGRR